MFFVLYVYIIYIYIFLLNISGHMWTYVIGIYIFNQYILIVYFFNDFYNRYIAIYLIYFFFNIEHK